MLLRLLTSAVTTVFAAFATTRIVWVAPSPLTYAGALPMFFCVGKITYSFCLNAIGLGTFILGREGSVNPPVAPFGARGNKVAVCLLCYNDDPREIRERLNVMLGMCRSEESAGFDWHVLSDTRDETVAEQERIVYATDQDAAVRYRRRVVNKDAKVGNIRDFLEENGCNYNYFCVLDADSVVDPELIVQLTRILDAHPHIAIVQPNIIPVGAERMSIFSRTIEFVAQTAAHISHVGNAIVQGGRSLYVGHNCLIRTAAFVDHVLPAYAASGCSPPLSHDFVESVILARCGYEIRSVYFESGSCEALPPNLIEWVTRDHRWCQGNMEHLSLAFRLQGIGFWNRVQLSMSSLAYLSSLFWIAIVALTIGSFGDDSYMRQFAVGGDDNGIGGGSMVRGGDIHHALHPAICEPADTPSGAVRESNRGGDRTPRPCHRGGLRLLGPVLPDHCHIPRVVYRPRRVGEHFREVVFMGGMDVAEPQQSRDRAAGERAPEHPPDPLRSGADVGPGDVQRPVVRFHPG